jgi:hypothetical protein
MHKQFVEFLSTNNKLSIHTESGNRKIHSTETTIINVTIDEKAVSLLVLLNMSIFYDIILTKLKKLGCTSSAILGPVLLPSILMI